MKRRAVFIDKDGTLLQNVPYNVNPERVRWMPGALDALKLFHEDGYQLVIVSNQPGLSLGYFSREDLRTLENHLRQIMQRHDIPLPGFYFCPHHADKNNPAGCDCRKPQPGLLLRAAEELDIDLAGSWMIGDILNDVEAGRRAGCRTVLFDSGGETEWSFTPERFPDYVAASWTEISSLVRRADVFRERLVHA